MAFSTKCGSISRQRDGGNGTGPDKYGKLIGIGLLILAIVDFTTNPPIIKIIFSVAIIGGAIFCLLKKYKLKGFPIAAIVLAAFCLLVGVTQANKYGMFKTSGNNNIADDLSEERTTATEQIPSEPSITNDANKTEQFDRKEDNEQADGHDENTTSVADTDHTDEAQDEDVTESPTHTSGVDPDLKAFLDSYEDFVDEYIVFMKKYTADPANAVSMMSEYTEFMEKYADFAKKVDRYDSKKMSTADAKYYLEVTTRCSQKMLKAY